MVFRKKAMIFISTIAYAEKLCKILFGMAESVSEQAKREVLHVPATIQTSLWAGGQRTFQQLLVRHLAE
jgi:hypothetical protein